jgi:ankyrin repeat/IBR domain-containing protein 1
MGGTNSKLRKYLESGDEYASLKIIEKHSELLTSFDANEPITELFESALQLSAKFAMKPLLRILLFECNGNPNKTNALHQNALHLVCQIPIPRTDTDINAGLAINSNSDPIHAVTERRTKCLALILDWNKVCQTNQKKTVIESIDINALDRSGNTALHFAAANGLLKCVQILVDHNCELFIENESGDTACDLAAKFNHYDIVRYLEFKIVFSDQSNAIVSDNSEYFIREEYSGLKPQDLQEAKDQLLIETSNMLNVSLSSAEALLRSFEWSQEALIDSWYNDSNSCFTKAGLIVPTHTTPDKPSDNGICDTEEKCMADIITGSTEAISSAVNNSKQSTEEMIPLCEICSLEIDSIETLDAQCGHKFCFQCWKTYLELKIESAETNAITCPAFDCSYLVTMEVIEKVVSPELTHRFIQYDIEAFIESNPHIKWCPFPACNKAVYLPESELSFKGEQAFILANLPPLPPISHAVDCGSGHYFCWECKREAHAPCQCKLREDWMIKISDVKAEELKETYSKTEDAANCLWLVRNAKQCPRCKTHIQKSEGCNHLRCSKCKYDFCWICLEAWKKHNSSTGGYFRCNRSEAAQKAEQNASLMKKVAEAQNFEMKELKRFVFHYTKYKFNDLSHETETSLIDKAKEKQNDLLQYYLEFTKKNSSEVVVEEDNFLYYAAFELICARKILCGSAVYGYYLEDHGYNKNIFEFMENDLNFHCNRLSDIISFEYLRASRSYIIDLTKRVKSKRLEFLTAISKGLIPPETPPGSKRHNRRHCLPGLLGLDSMENIYNSCDENDSCLLNEAIISSLDDCDINNSWVQDRNGRHSNLLAIYDWPDDCDEDYHNPISSTQAMTTSLDENSSENCNNSKCNRTKAKNPRTGETHDFCSLKCKYLTKSEKNSEDIDGKHYEYDSSMDLLLAIEMSKLSALEERERLNSSQNIDINFDPTNQQIDKSSENNEIIFESFVKNLKSDKKLIESSAKPVIMFFLKSSIDEKVDEKNIKPEPNDEKVEKKLFSCV